MIIKKRFKGDDGIERQWLYDSDNNYIQYSGLAKDLDRRFIINTTNKTAQEIIDEVVMEES